MPSPSRGRFVCRSPLVRAACSSLFIAASLVAVDAAAQTPADSAARDSVRAQRLGAVVVTAERAPAPLATSTAAVTRLTAAQLRQLPVTTVAGALELVPGIVVLHSDASGDAPRLAVRGFYGGGETEYVTVLLDGVPLTGLATGQVNWDLVPLAALEAIEVVRGGASAAYGDAAVGGVVNLITRRPASEGAWRSWRVEGGELGTIRAGGASGGSRAGRAGSLFADVRRSDGFRPHEQRDATTLGGSLELAHGARGSLALSALEHRRAFDEPGPLTDAALAASRTAASPFFRFDRTEEHVHRLGLDGSARTWRAGRVSGYLNAERATADAVRTQPLSAQFADAQARETGANRLVGSVQLESSGVLAGLANRLVLGADLSLGRLTSAYRPVVTGDSAAFAGASGARGDVYARGHVRRAGEALFASWEVTPVEALRLTAGGRVDRVDDRFTPAAPSDGGGRESKRTAWSPRAGANLRWLESARQTGHVYVSAGRSFKAPTMDQLFDQRATPIPFPPYSVMVSNAALVPQYGSSVEAGLYHLASLAGQVRARLSLSAYRMEMRDELDFDLQQFKYVNIGRSRHRGIEAGLTLSGPGATSGFADYTRQDATSLRGENAGKQLKAVPRDVWALGIARAPLRGLGLAATATSVRDVFLDDANARRLDPWTRLDVRASYALRGVRLAVNVRNLLDRKYSTTGFPDPAGSATLLLYPAAGRVVTVGLESAR